MGGPIVIRPLANRAVYPREWYYTMADAGEM